MRRAVFLLAACGAPTPARPPAVTNDTPARPPTVVEPDAFLASLDPTRPIEVRVAGDGEQSLLGKKRCAYWEWMYGEADHSSWSIAFHSESPVTLVAGDRQVTIDYRDLRANLAPEYEHVFRKGDPEAPGVVADALAAVDAPPSEYVAEYCLEVGQTYRALADDEQYETPGPGGGIAEHTHRVLHVGDAKDETPAYRGWSY